MIVPTVVYLSRETTTLERKLEKLATDIGNLGLAAAGSVLLFQSAQYTWQRFFVEGEAWQWSYLSDYLHFIITAVTVVVRSDAHKPMTVSPPCGPDGNQLVVSWHAVCWYFAEKCTA